MKKLLVLLLISAALSARALETLTYEEKAGQTLFAFTDIDNIHKYRAAIERGAVGGVLLQWGNYSLRQTREAVAKMQSWAQKSPKKIPLLIAIDYEGGTVYTPVTLGFEFLPTNMMLAAARDANLTARVFYLAAQQLRGAGLHINFSPVLDVNTNPRNPIIGVRSFGDDHELVSEQGVAVINGLKAGGIFSAGKHFPGHGGTGSDSHHTLPVVEKSKEEMDRVHLAPFQKAIDAGVGGIMSSHVIFRAYDPDLPATYSKKVLVDLLQKQMGFNGLIITDALDMKGAAVMSAESGSKDTTQNIALAAAKSIEAGGDIALLGWGINALKVFETVKAVQAPAFAKRIDEAASKILALKEEMGLFGGERETATASLRAYRAAAEEAAQKSVTVMRDRNKLIPLSFRKENGAKPKVCSVFFVPPRFAEHTAAFRKPFLQAGWEERFYNASVSPNASDRKRIDACMKGADLVVLGSTQWASKAQRNQVSVINKILAEHKNTVLISLLSPYDAEIYKTAPTVLLNYGINRYSIKASADILLGNMEPTGRLPLELEE